MTPQRSSDDGPPVGSIGSNRLNLLIAITCACYVLAVAHVPRFTEWSPVACPWHRFLGLHCATCGLTRAMACLARFDPVGAMRFNPLVVLIAPWATMFTINAVGEAVGGRSACRGFQRAHAWVWRVFLASAWSLPEFCRQAAGEGTLAGCRPGAVVSQA